MKSKAPLIRACIYILLTAVIMLGIHTMTYSAIKSQSNHIKNSVALLQEKETVLTSLTNKQKSLSRELSNLKVAIEETSAGNKILVNQSDLKAYLNLLALDKEVSIEHIDFVDFCHKNDVWEVQYNIGVHGVYQDIVAFIDAVSKIGDNYFTSDMSLLQNGPYNQDDFEGAWWDNQTYLSYNVKQKEGLQGFYYIGGKVSFPVVIDTANGPKPFIRLENIVYSDPSIVRYDWQIDEAKLIIGEAEHGLGYPKVDFDKQELILNVDFELEETMIGSTATGIKFSWRSLNDAHEAVIPFQRPIVITEEMFSSEPWEGKINEEIASYNQEMLNSIVHADFNIVFLMEEVPDVYFDFVAEQIENLKTLVQNNQVSVSDDKLIVHGEEEKVYTISDNKLFLNDEPLFELINGQFVLEDQSVRIELNVLNDVNYNLTLEGVSVQPIEEQEEVS